MKVEIIHFKCGHELETKDESIIKQKAQLERDVCEFCQGFISA